MKQLFFAVMVGALILLSAPDSKASPWQQMFYESGVGSFDTMEMFMKEGAVSFTSLDAITDLSWTSFVSPQYATTTGNATSEPYFYFNVGFSDSTPFLFNFYAFLDETILEGARVAFTGCAWNITGMDLDTARTQYVTDLATVNPVPEPTTLLLFGTGIAGLTFIRRRKA